MVLYALVAASQLSALRSRRCVRLDLPAERVGLLLQLCDQRVHTRLTNHLSVLRTFQRQVAYTLGDNVDNLPAPAAHVEHIVELHGIVFGA